MLSTTVLHVVSRVTLFVKVSTSNKRRLVAVASLLLATLAWLASNLAASTFLKPMRFDFTEEGLFTLSDKTKHVLSAIEEPITVRLYFSHRIGEQSSSHAIFYSRLKGLLLQYADLAAGMLKVELIDPEPFSEIEDRAVAFGLQGVPVTESGEVGYFGLAATNSVDAQEIVPFFNLERETFLEYDLTRLIHNLNATKRKTIGILSTLPLERAGMTGVEDTGVTAIIHQQHQQTTPWLSWRWLVMEQIRDLFELHILQPTTEILPPDIDVLMLIQPRGLSVKTLYAIDQFVLNGGRVLAFIDPVSEHSRHSSEDMAFFGDFPKLLYAWGIQFSPDLVAANIDSARRVSTNQKGRSVIADYVAWLTLGRDTFDDEDAVVGTLEQINVATAGILEPVAGATSAFHPIVVTSPRSMRLTAGSFVSPLPDVLNLVRNFHSENQRLTIATRITGIVSSAFSDGSLSLIPTPNDRSSNQTIEINPSKEERAIKPANIIVVADSDILADDFWVQKQDFFGQQLAIPVADNGTFVLNALEDLSGTDALIGLRGRGRTNRPFVLVEALRRDAELRYRAKEQALLQQIEAVQSRMRSLERRESNNSKSADTFLTAEEREVLANFRHDLLTVRRELRDVKHALAQDIERLASWFKAINIAGIPLLITIIAISLAVHRSTLVKRDYGVTVRKGIIHL